MSRAEQGADQVRHAAEREHKGTSDEDRRKADRDAAAAHPAVTDRRLSKGHSSGDDSWRDKPVDTERDKDLKGGGIEGAARKQRGGA